MSKNESKVQPPEIISSGGGSSNNCIQQREDITVAPICSSINISKKKIENENDDSNILLSDEICSTDDADNEFYDADNKSATGWEENSGSDNNDSNRKKNKLNISEKIRKENRLALNRESAKKRRKKKKMFLEKLEVKYQEMKNRVHTLGTSNDNLRSKVDKLESELELAKSTIALLTQNLPMPQPLLHFSPPSSVGVPMGSTSTPAPISTPTNNNIPEGRGGGGMHATESTAIDLSVSSSKDGIWISLAQVPR